MGLWVTTAYDADDELEHAARQLAEQLSCSWMPRRRQSIARLMRTYGASRLLVVTREGLKLHTEPGVRPVHFHPGMAYLRVARLLDGKSDPLVEVAQIKPGDRILDCTAGLASDAIVFAHAAGEEGEVTALESEPALCRLVSDGLKRYETDNPAVNEAMRRIRIVCADHEHYLPTLASSSVDVVYFDPMFRKPLELSADMEPLRGAANPAALMPASIEQARRVARRCVVLKEQVDSGEFQRLGFHTVHRTDGKIAYGVMKV